MPRATVRYRVYGTSFRALEVALISTCNRVELYVARETHGHPRAEEMIEFLAKFHDIDSRVFASNLIRSLKGSCFAFVHGGIKP